MVLTGWTDKGMSWGDLRGHPLEPHGTALVAAASERLAARQIVDVWQGQTVGHFLDNAVDALLGYAVLQMDGTGWNTAFVDGGGMPLSEAGVLAAIGAGERIRWGGRGYVYRAEWAQQVYGILNQMVRLRVRSQWAADWTWLGGEARSGSGASWAAAQAAWSAAAWVPYVSVEAAPLWTWPFYDYAARRVGGTYTMVKGRTRWRLSGLAQVGAGLTAQVLGAFGTPAARFEAPDYAAAEGEEVLWQTTVTEADAVVIDGLASAAVGVHEPSDLSGAYDYGAWVRFDPTHGFERVYVVVNLDAPGGFTFRPGA